MTIAELATLVRDVVGLKARLIFDQSKPDGTHRKLLDSGRLLTLGWKPSIALRDGIASVYEDFTSGRALSRLKS